MDTNIKNQGPYIAENATEEIFNRACPTWFFKQGGYPPPPSLPVKQTVAKQQWPDFTIHICPRIAAT